MGVRVRVKLKSGNREVPSSALVNTGYEGFRPEIHVPLALAKKLGFSLEDVKSEKYTVVGGEAPPARRGAGDRDRGPEEGPVEDQRG